MSNIDEKAKNNFTIEMRIFENYEKVKHEIIKVIDFLEHSGTAMGMCNIFNSQDHEFFCMLCLGMPLTCVEIFVCSMFKAFLGMPLIRKPKNTRY